MPRTPRRRAAPHPGESRTKLDPRLAYLAGLPVAALRRLKAGEEEAARLAARRMAGAAGQPGDEDPGATLPQGGLAPLTAGVLMPAPGRKRKGGRSFHARFDEPVFSVFLLGEACAEELLELGIVPRTAAGGVRTAFVPRSRLRALEGCEGVRYVELARAWSCDLGQAIPLAQIDTLHTATPPVDGSNVIIGVIDNALDIHHPAFHDATGKTRVLYLWDQQLEPGPGEAGPPIAPALPGFVPKGGVTYGVEYDKARIDLELSTVNPPAVPPYKTVRHAPPDPANGQAAFNIAAHGTMVTGCAAGNGAGGSAVGAAPGSRIIFVSPLNYDSGLGLNADNAAILDACAYIFARAEEEKKPCVINISMGDNQGPHDGTTCGERFLDDLLARPGRAITLSAGNATTLAAHADGRVPPGGSVTLKLQVSAAAGSAQPLPVNSDAIEIWYDGHDRIAVTLTPPGQNAAPIGPIGPGAPPFAASVGGITVRITSTLHDPRNGDNWISILLIVPAGQSIPLGDWTITLLAQSVINGAYNAWVDRNNRPLLKWATPQAQWLTIGVPSSAALPITVGNHVKAGTPPPLSPDSGRGPSRDGRIKPEIAAVGRSVSMPFPRNMYLVPPGQPGVASASGTSFSAPIVAGAAALLFQCRGATATAADIKQILTQTAATTGLAVPDNGFGFGMLRMGAACTVAAPNVDVWLRDDGPDDGSEPFVRPVFWASPDIELFDVASNPIANPVHVPGARFSTIVRVTARNRGTQAARNVSVFLYWADPATSLPFPEAWQATGIYTGGAGPPPFPAETNRIVLPLLGPGASATADFAWAPPAPGSGLAGDGHFCLLARLEHELDPSAIAQGGFLRIPASNNLGLRNVHVATSAALQAMRFHLRGSAGADSLMVLSELDDGIAVLRLPAGLLAVNARAALERVSGATRIAFAGEVAALHAGRDRPLVIEGLRLAHGATAPASIEVPRRGARGAVHVVQLSGGARIGGVTLQLEGAAAERPRCDV